MGGTVAVTIKKNNLLKKMARRTGSYNWLLFSEEQNFGDQDKALEDFYKPFDDMRRDYLNGEPYKIYMTPAYGWCHQMIPVDYGLVFIDYDTQQIHSMQGFDCPGEFYLTHLSRYFEQNNDKEQLILKDKVNLIFRTRNGAVEASLQDVFKTSDNHQILKMLKIMAENPASHYFNFLKDYFNLVDEELRYAVNFKLKNWTVYQYEENNSGIIDFFCKVKPYLNVDEINGWRQYLENSLEDFRDDTLEQMHNSGASQESMSQYLKALEQPILEQFDALNT